MSIFGQQVISYFGPVQHFVTLCSDAMLKTDMKDILAGCIDTKVVDADQNKGKKRKRKGMKLQRKKEQMVKKEEPKQQETPTINGISVQRWKLSFYLFIQNSGPP